MSEIGVYVTFRIAEEEDRELDFPSAGPAIGQAWAAGRIVPDGAGAPPPPHLLRLLLEWPPECFHHLVVLPPEPVRDRAHYRVGFTATVGTLVPASRLHSVLFALGHEAAEHHGVVRAPHVHDLEQALYLGRRDHSYRRSPPPPPPPDRDLTSTACAQQAGTLAWIAAHERSAGGWLADHFVRPLLTLDGRVVWWYHTLGLLADTPPPRVRGGIVSDHPGLGTERTFAFAIALAAHRVHVGQKRPRDADRSGRDAGTGSASVPPSPCSVHVRQYGRPPDSCHAWPIGVTI